MFHHFLTKLILSDASNSKIFHIVPEFRFKNHLFNFAIFYFFQFINLNFLCIFNHLIYDYSRIAIIFNLIPADRQPIL